MACATLADGRVRAEGCVMPETRTVIAVLGFRRAAPGSEPQAPPGSRDRPAPAEREGRTGHRERCSRRAHGRTRSRADARCSRRSGSRLAAPELSVDRFLPYPVCVASQPVLTPSRQEPRPFSCASLCGALASSRARCDRARSIRARPGRDRLRTPRKNAISTNANRQTATHLAKEMRYASRARAGDAPRGIVVAFGESRCHPGAAGDTRQAEQETR